MKIHILKEEVIKKIAAGEVVERPASVLKELLENSLDAGAKSIKVDIEKAGKILIRVNDDGAGMSPEDCVLALERHATSKITDFEDLNSLRSFGFRGEALYSIAAVSRLCITSCGRTAGAKGWKIKSEGGKLVSQLEAPPVPGATVEIRDLFFNVPAREKFLKSGHTETSHLLRVAEEASLANCATAFHIYVDGAEAFVLPAADSDSIDNILSRVKIILGKAAADSLISLRSPAFNAKALISRPEGMSAGRGSQYFFVNRRPVSSRILQQALYKAYSMFRHEGRHPACVIFMELPPCDFDVNIHPQKRDIRFKNEGDIFKMLHSFLEEGLAKERRPAGLISSGFPQAQIDPGAKGINDPAANYLARSPQVFAPGPELEQILPGFHKEHSGPSWYNPPFTFLGQIEKTYLVFESNGGILILDQHAAAERVIYERYMSQLLDKKPQVQPLMLPLSVDLPPSKVEDVLRWKEWLAGAGFEIERFGPGTVLAHSTPSVFEFSPAGMKEFLERLSDTLGDPKQSTEETKRMSIASLACKKAVKAHDRLKNEEALRLIEDLKSCKDSFTCPHGRPAILSLSRNELSRRFQR